MAASITLRECESLESESLKYPTVDGTAGQFIITDGAGNLSFGGSGGGNEGSATLSITAGSPPDTSILIPTTLDSRQILSVSAIGNLAGGGTISFLIKASYKNVADTVFKVGIVDDYLINKDAAVTRDPGIRMDVQTQASGNSINILVSGDTVEDVTFDVSWTVVESTA